MRSPLEQAADELKKGGRPEPYRVFAGFDGFVDLIARPVRCFGEETEYFETIEEFGRYLIGKSGKSCSVELRRVTEKLGGNMPIYTDALERLGVVCTRVGSLGYPDPLPLFSGASGPVESVTNPGACTALEFSDGKVMLAQNADVDSLDYPLMRSRIPPDRLCRHLQRADAAAFLNWSELRGGTSIWKGFLAEILPGLSGPKKLLLLDISDCSRRPACEIREMLALAREFTAYFRVVFSMNRNEACEICRALRDPFLSPSAAGRRIREETGAWLLVMHLVDGALGFMADGEFRSPNRFIPQPSLSTGGGDNFNAGLTYALLRGCRPQTALAIANAASGFYVENARSPNQRELAEAIEGWKSEEMVKQSVNS